MTLDQLQVLKTIVETGSFRHAAGELHRAQSAVSYAIKSLEDDLGLKLFSRKSYRPSLTPQGKVIYQKALEILDSQTDLKDLAYSLSRGEEPEIRVAISAISPLKQILPCFKEFSDQHPHTQLKVSVEVLSAQESLEEGRSDISITEVSQNFLPELEYIPVTQIKMHPVCAPDYPLAKKSQKSALRGSVQIALSSSNERSAGIAKGVNTWSVSDFSTKKEFLIHGLGWGFMPRHIIEKELKQKTLVPIGLEVFKPFEIGIYAIRKPKTHTGPANENLWTLLQSH